MGVGGGGGGVACVFVVTVVCKSLLWFMFVCLWGCCYILLMSMCECGGMSVGCWRWVCWLFLLWWVCGCCGECVVRVACVWVGV